MEKYILKTNLFYIVTFSVLLSGCYSGAGIYRVESKVDPYNDTHILKQVDNGIMGFMNDDNANTYYMDIYYDLKQNEFYLNVQVIRDNWLFIKSIIILADAKKLEFPYSEKNRHVIDIKFTKSPFLGIRYLNTMSFVSDICISLSKLISNDCIAKLVCLL